MQLRFIESRINGQQSRTMGGCSGKELNGGKRQIHAKGTCLKLAELIVEKLSLKNSFFFKSIL